MKKSAHRLKNENESDAAKKHLFSQKMDLHQEYLVNPAYKFKADYNNVIITNNNPARYDSSRYRDDITQGFAWRTHPDLAVLFSSFDGILTLNETAETHCFRHGTNLDEFFRTVKPCICNEEPVLIPAGDRQWVQIPKNFLKES